MSIAIASKELATICVVVSLGVARLHPHNMITKCKAFMWSLYHTFVLILPVYSRLQKIFAWFCLIAFAMPGLFYTLQLFVATEDYRPKNTLEKKLMDLRITPSKYAPKNNKSADTVRRASQKVEEALNVALKESHCANLVYNILSQVRVVVAREIYPKDNGDYTPVEIAECIARLKQIFREGTEPKFVTRICVKEIEENYANEYMREEDPIGHSWCDVEYGPSYDEGDFGYFECVDGDFDRYESIKIDLRAKLLAYEGGPFNVEVIKVKGADGALKTYALMPRFHVNLTENTDDRDRYLRKIAIRLLAREKAFQEAEWYKVVLSDLICEIPEEFLESEAKIYPDGVLTWFKVQYLDNEFSERFRREIFKCGLHETDMVYENGRYVVFAVMQINESAADRERIIKNLTLHFMQILQSQS